MRGIFHRLNYHPALTGSSALRLNARLLCTLNPFR